MRVELSCDKCGRTRDFDVADDISVGVMGRCRCLGMFVYEAPPPDRTRSVDDGVYASRQSEPTFRRDSALHEAAHAIAAFKCNVKIHRVGLDRDGGFTDYDGHGDDVAKAIISAAPLALGLGVSRSDEARFGEYVDGLWGDFALNEARQMLTDETGQMMLREVAQALSEQGQLTGEEVRLICQSVEEHVGW